MLVAGCSQLPTSGPSAREVQASAAGPGAAAIQVVDVDDAITRRLLAQRTQHLFSETLGQTHRLANPGKVPLEIIEVQSGSYLGEDDIVRFEDTYGRK